MSTQLHDDLRATAASPAPAGDAAVRTTGLTKRFRGGQVAVNALDLDVPRGAVYGFLGPNGSGKTTTIRMLLGLVAPTDGTHALLGEPMPRASAQVLPRVGALVEGPAFHPYLSGWDNLVRLDAADRTVARGQVRQRVGEALDRVGLAAAASKRYRNYSLGMRQRLGLAGALLRPRELYVLDEPTNGLDPQGTREVRTLLHEVAAEGATVLVSSHLLSEIEQVCTHAGVMSAGRLVYQGTLPDLRRRAGEQVRVTTSAPEAAAAVLLSCGTGTPHQHDGYVLADLGGQGDQGDVAVEHLTERLVMAGVPVRGIAAERPDLESIFVQLTGEGFDVER